jgi:hypothetical protein
MSLIRLIIWSSLIGGWSAFFGWLLPELIFGRYIDRSDIDPTYRIFLAIFMAVVVAVPIGGGISVAGGLTNPDPMNLLKRLVLGFAGALLGGLIASLAGACIFRVFENVYILGSLSRILGWMLIGMGIGVGVGASEGIISRSFTKMRNGLIGGVIGGFLGGALFVPIGAIASPMSSRAVSFVLLGLFIGLSIGLAQVILKEAWITVEAGFRPGRQIILGQDLITMGTSEKSSMIFIAFGAKGVEPTHLKIAKQTDGRYLLEDNQSRSGTLLNGQPINAATALKDGDAIQLGVNVVRFNERVKHGDGRLPPPVVMEPAKAPAPVPANAIQAAAPKPGPTMEIPAKSAPPKPAAPVPAQRQEGRCPICDQKIIGIPGERRCGTCFTTF